MRRHDAVQCPGWQAVHGASDVCYNRDKASRRARRQRCVETARCKSAVPPEGGLLGLFAGHRGQQTQL